MPKLTFMAGGGCRFREEVYLLIEFILNAVGYAAILWLAMKLVRVDGTFRGMLIIGFSCAAITALGNYFEVPSFMTTSVNGALTFILIWRLTDADPVPDIGLMTAVATAVKFMLFTVALVQMENMGVSGFGDLAAAEEEPLELEDVPLPPGVDEEYAEMERLTEELEAQDHSAASSAEAAPVSSPRILNSATLVNQPATVGFAQETVLRGTQFPFRLIAPAGWTREALEGCELYLFRDDVVVRVYVERAGPDNQTFANEQARAVLAGRPDLRLLSQQVANLSSRPWGRFDYQETGTNWQLILFAHASDRGCYRLELEGPRESLEVHQADLARVIESFRFPPDNFDMSAGTTVVARPGL